MIPELLQKIIDDYNKDPEKFNYRSWVPKLKDPELKSFLDSKYPNVKLISEKLYLFLHNMEEPPKDHVFKQFKYIPKDQVNKPTHKLNDDSIKIAKQVAKDLLLDSDVQNLFSATDNIQETIGDMFLSEDLETETYITFLENDFWSQIKPGHQIYFSRLGNIQNRQVGIFYCENLNLVYLCYLPNTLKIHALKEYIERDYECTLYIDRLPLSILTDVSNFILNAHSACIALLPMSYVYTKKHNLY